MNPETLFELEKVAYPTGTFSPMGEHLRAFTRNESTHVPPVQVAGSKSLFYPIIVPTRRNVLKNRKNIRRIMQMAVSRDNTLVLFFVVEQQKKKILRILPGHFQNFSGRRLMVRFRTITARRSLRPPTHQFHMVTRRIFHKSVILLCK